MARGLYRPRVLACVACVAAGVVLAPHVLRLVHDLRTEPMYAVAAADIRITRPDASVPPVLLQRVLERAKLPDPFSVLEPDLASRLRRACEREPWVESVERIEVSRVNGVSLSLRYRIPALSVDAADGRQVVDRHGILLPVAEVEADALNALPLLRVNGPAPITPGLRWRDPDVVDAARLAAIINPTGQQAAPRPSPWRRGGFQSLVRGPDDAWELRKPSGTRVVWGHVDEVASEPTDKLRRLNVLLDRRPDLAGAGGPHRIDLRPWDMIAVEPVIARPR